jgi:hypothetical protein
MSTISVAILELSKMCNDILNTLIPKIKNYMILRKNLESKDVF